jgi:hypothetical protein
MILRPTKTVAGRQATFNSTANGTQLVLTHISIGDVGGAIDDSLTGLRSERERVACFGSRISPDQIHLDSVFSGPAEYWVREIGIWAGPVLVYYWSTTGAELGYKGANFEWLVGLDLAIDPTADSQVTVTAAPPNVGMTVVPYMATILKSLADTNRLVLLKNYLN